jgi:glycine/D-amino acid oxidase-like deaminating enzyme
LKKTIIFSDSCPLTINTWVYHAGHNGLIAAAYLQKAGIQTCILEKRHVVGGAAVTEEIVPGFKFSRASYLLSLLRPHIYLDLELQVHIYVSHNSVLMVSLTPVLLKYPVGSTVIQ